MPLTLILITRWFDYVYELGNHLFLFLIRVFSLWINQFGFLFTKSLLNFLSSPSILRHWVIRDSHIRGQECFCCWWNSGHRDLMLFAFLENVRFAKILGLDKHAIIGVFELFFVATCDIFLSIVRLLIGYSLVVGITQSNSFTSISCAAINNIRNMRLQIKVRFHFILISSIILWVSSWILTTPFG